MDLEKLKQMSEENEKERERVGSLEIDEFKRQLYSDEFDRKLQESLETRIQRNAGLQVEFMVEKSNSDEIIVKVRGWTENLIFISFTDLYEKNNVTTHYNSDIIKQLLPMYDLLKTRIEELGFIITKEWGDDIEKTTQGLPSKGSCNYTLLRFALRG